MTDKKSIPEQSLLHAVLQTVNSLVLVLDEDNRILEFNNACEKATGYTFDEVKNKDFRDIFLREEDKKQVQNVLRQAKNKDYSTNDNYWKTKAGNLILISWNNKLFNTEDGKKYIICTGTDITQTEQAEQILQFTQFSVDKASDAVFWVGKDAKFIYVNEVASQIFGYTNEELLNMHVYDLEISPNAKNNWPKFWDHLKEIKTALVESKVRRKDGSIFPLEINTSYFKFRDKEIKVSLARDITERKRAEEKIKAINHDLSTFIYRSTHDLKAPLASLSGLINLAKTELHEPNAKQYLQLIEECSAKLNNILIMLIQAMTVKENKINPDWVKVDKILDEVLTRLKFLSGFSNIDFHIKNSVTDFYTDDTLLVSLLQNIVENAVKFQDPSAPFPYIYVEISVQDNDLNIVVTDNGIGIDEKLQPHVFDMFYRATSESKGSGLGLYLVKSIVEKLDGTINIESIVGGGTTLKITLPSADKV